MASRRANSRNISATAPGSGISAGSALSALRLLPPPLPPRPLPAPPRPPQRLPPPRPPPPQPLPEHAAPAAADMVAQELEDSLPGLPELHLEPNCYGIRGSAHARPTLHKRLSEQLHSCNCVVAVLDAFLFGVAFVVARDVRVHGQPPCAPANGAKSHDVVPAAAVAADNTRFAFKYSTNVATLLR